MATKITIPTYAESEIRQRVAASSAIEQEIIADALPVEVCLEKVIKEIKFLRKEELAYLYNAEIIKKHRDEQRGELNGIYRLGRTGTARL